MIISLVVAKKFRNLSERRVKLLVIEMVLKPIKGRKQEKGYPVEGAAGPRDAELNITPDSMQTEPRTAINQFLPDQLMQGHYVLGHNFGQSTSQNHLHDNLNHFGQASAFSTLEQQPFPGNGQLTQGYPGDMHALQVVGTNPQIDHQNGDQGQSLIPVWDFLSCTSLHQVHTSPRLDCRWLSSDRLIATCLRYFGG